MTVTTVSNDQKRKPTGEEIITFWDRTCELHRRFREGSLNPETCLVSIQHLIEGKGIVDDELVHQPQTAFVDRAKKLDLGNVLVPAATGAICADCFKAETIYCEMNPVEILGENIAPIGAGLLAGYVITDPKGMTFSQMAAAMLGMPESHEELKKALKEYGYVLHPKQVFDLLLRTSRGEVTGLLKDEEANFFFTIDERGEVVVLVGCWASSRCKWFVGVYSLESCKESEMGRRFFCLILPK